jgi:hypothetical protein
MGYRRAAQLRRSQYVRGHYRRGKNGDLHWVSGHMRNETNVGCGFQVFFVWIIVGWIPAFYSASGSTLIFLLIWLAPIWMMLVSKAIEIFSIINSFRIGSKDRSDLLECFPVRRCADGVTVQSIMEDAKAELGVFYPNEKLVRAINYYLANDRRAGSPVPSYRASEVEGEIVTIRDCRGVELAQYEFF